MTDLDKSFKFGLEGFRLYIRDKISFQRKDIKFDDMQMEAAFYSDLKLLCEEYYKDLNILNQEILKDVNNISNTTQTLIKNKQDTTLNDPNFQKMGHTHDQHHHDKHKHQHTH